MVSKCAVLEAKDKIAIKSVEVPELMEGILVKVYACGVCGTDPHVVSGRFKATKYPSILGHEFYGEIIKIANDCDVECINGKLEIGDIIALVPGKSCGECIYCKELPEEEQICPHRETYGLNVPMDSYPIMGGGYSQYAIIKNGFKVYKVNESWNFGYATLLEPAAVAVKAVEKGIKNSEKTKERELKIAIQGVGTIGLLIANQLRRLGYNPIIFDIRENRIKTANDMKFDRTILLSDIDMQIDNFVKENDELGAEILSMFDVVWVGEDDEKALHLAGLPKLKQNNSGNSSSSYNQDNGYELPF